MAQDQPRGIFSGGRLLIIGLLTVIIVPGLALIMAAVGSRVAPVAPGSAIRENALADSADQCVLCHKNATPGIVEQYGVSTMAHANVTCSNCHVVTADYAGAVAHQGTYVLNQPTTAKCQSCHASEVAQYYQSRHSLPAYVAYAGAKDLPANLMTMYQAIPEGRVAPDSARNALYALEGPQVTEFACKTCHSIGFPAADGSVGQCQKCHLRHEFSLEQARKPETCNNCHIGPDHPQWEIYQESPHGIKYATEGSTWNWSAEPGTLTVNDFPAPTCSICHMSGFGANGTTHDVGDRLTWFLFAQSSDRRPGWQDNKARMQTVCLQCHNTNFVQTYYDKADLAVDQVNKWVAESDTIIKPLNDQKLLTDVQFDVPIKFTYFEVWHHWGRTTKFGTWMQGPDYTQWHGAYEVLHSLSELRKEAADMLKQAPSPQ